MKFRQVTEENSLYDNLEQQPVRDLLRDINREDHRVADAVEACLPQVEAFVVRALTRIQQGGRLFYIGAGTSGRLGVLDASEIPPTFGMPEDTVFRSFSTSLLYLQAPLSAHKKPECRSTLLCLSSVGHDRQPEFVSGSLIDLLLLKQLLVEVLKPDHFCRPFFRSLCTLHENSPFWAF